MWRFALMGSLAMSKPLMVTVPELDGMTPQMIFIVVDFPAPFGPRKPRIS